MFPTEDAQMEALIPSSAAAHCVPRILLRGQLALQLYTCRFGGLLAKDLTVASYEAQVLVYWAPTTLAFVCMGNCNLSHKFQLSGKLAQYVCSVAVDHVRVAA